jgi:hypothetical protein
MEDSDCYLFLRDWGLVPPILTSYLVKFQVPRATNMEMVVFWGVAHHFDDLGSKHALKCR